MYPARIGLLVSCMPVLLYKTSVYARVRIRYAYLVPDTAVGILVRSICDEHVHFM